MSSKDAFMLTTNNEDYHSEFKVLDRVADKAKVLHIVGGADNTLEMLTHPHVDCMTGADSDSSALHLVRFKLAVALSSLTNDEALDFLGRSGEVNAKRVLQFEEFIVPHLPQETVEYLRGYTDDISRGIIRTGGNSKIQGIMRQRCASHGVEMREIYSDPEACRKVAGLLREGKLLDEGVFKSVMDTVRMPEEVLKIILPLLPTWAHSTSQIGANLIESLGAGKTDRFYFSDVWTDGFYSPGVSPLWLTDDGRKALKEKVAQNKIKTVLGNINTLEATEKFDFISLSNIYDWMSIEAAAVSIKEIITKHLAPNGYIMVRRGSGGCSKIFAATGMSHELFDFPLCTLEHNPHFFNAEDTVGAAKFNQ